MGLYHAPVSLFIVDEVSFFPRVVRAYGGVDAVSNRNSLQDVCFKEGKQNAFRQHCFCQVTAQVVSSGTCATLFHSSGSLISFNQSRHFMVKRKVSDI